MTDEALLAALEAGTLPPAAFDHAAHVRAGRLYLRAHGLGGAIIRMRAALERLARAAGREDAYHETVTVAFLALIGERLDRQPDAEGWDAFARANPDLLDRRLLARHYPPEVLRSERARRVFLLPGPRA